MINTYKEEDKPLIITAVTALLLAVPAQSIEEMIAGHLVAIKTPTRERMESDLAVTIAQRLLAAVRVSPESCIRFVKFYGIDTRDPQCDVELSDGIFQVKLLGGLDQETGAYLVSEFDQSKITKKRLEIRSIRARLDVITERQKILNKLSIVPAESKKEFA